MSTYEAYTLLQDTLQPIVEARAPLIERDYLVALESGEAHLHELHSETLEITGQEAVAVRAVEIADTGRQIDEVKDKLQSPWLTGMERKALKAQKKELKKVRKAFMGERQEAVDSYRELVRQAAWDKAQAELEQTNVLDFWMVGSLVPETPSQAMPKPDVDIEFPDWVNQGAPQKPVVEKTMSEDDLAQLKENMTALRNNLAYELAQPAPNLDRLTRLYEIGQPIIKQASEYKNISLEDGYRYFDQLVVKRIQRIHAARQKVAENEATLIPAPENRMANFPIEVGSASHESRLDSSSDRSIVDTENGLFAVFRGLGDDSGQGRAAGVAEQAVAQFFANGREQADSAENAQEVHKALVRAHHEIINNRRKIGQAVGTVVKLFKDEQGKLFAGWASVGNSRLYKLNERKGTVEQLTTDEEDSRGFVNNRLGRMGDEPVQQSTEALQEGDYLVLCSGGSGEFTDHDGLDYDVVGDAIFGEDSSQEAASKLAKAAGRENPGATAIVISTK